ncbi:MAG: ComEC/Rec2 family competence protein, partial [Brevinematales bacterium]
MGAASLVFVVGFFFGVYGNWVDWMVGVFLYGVVIGFRRWVLWVCIVLGLVLGFWKASQKEKYVSGYTERTLVVTSHPILSPEGMYMHRSGELVFFSDTPWFLGDTVAIRGKIRLTKTGSVLYPYEVSLVKRQNVLGFFSRIFLFWQENIEKHISASSFRSLVFALVLGNRLFLDYGTKREFQLSGLFHLLAISGLHLALIAGAFQRLLGFFFSQKRAWFLSTLLLSLYALV